MRYLRLLILLLMSVALAFQVEGVWALLTVTMLLTLNAPPLMIALSAMALGLLETYARFAHYLLFHFLVYVACAVTLLLRLTYLINERGEGDVL